MFIVSSLENWPCYQWNPTISRDIYLTVNHDIKQWEDLRLYLYKKYASCWPKLQPKQASKSKLDQKAFEFYAYKLFAKWVLVSNYVSYPDKPYCTTSIDSFTVSLHSPNGRHLPAIRLYKGTVNGLCKTLEFPPVMWSHNALHEGSSQIYIWISQLHSLQYSQSETMSHTLITVLLPPG